MPPSIYDRVTALKQKQSRLQYYQGNLYALATEVLGFDRLTLEFHKPMLDDADRMRREWRLGHGKFLLWVWAREHYKTTCLKAMVCQDFLWNPQETITWWHAVEDMAQEVCEAVGRIILTNKEYRKLFEDGILPSPNAKRFLSRREFRLRSNNPQHAPSFRAWGAGSEATGGHSRIGYLDDVVAKNDVDDNQLPAKKRWYGQTVMNVIEVGSGGILRAAATPWDPEDLQAGWRRSPDWKTTVRAVYETDGVPDYKGKSVLHPEKFVALKRRNMTASDFAFQMMCDDSPQSEKPWNKETCERAPITEAEAMKGPGFIVVLSDSAPTLVGSFYEDKQRADGDKNEWAIVTVRLRAWGQRAEIILLDGAASKDWTPDQGWREMCRQKRRWNTGNCAVEKTGQAIALYMADLERISREERVRHSPVDLTMTYKGKNVQFSALASRAAQGEVLFCQSVPQAFLDGTGDEHASLLYQLRMWRALPGGRNSLKLDDRANAFSFATDPAFEKYVPSVHVMQDSDLEEFGETESMMPQRSRYCG